MSEESTTADLVGRERVLLEVEARAPAERLAEERG
jgi:hypothetical protein